MTCTGCSLPESQDAARVVFLWPPNPHTLAKIADHFDAGGVTYARDGREGYLHLTAEDAAAVVVDLCALLTDRERADTRCLIADSADPTFGEFGKVAPLDRVLDRVNGDWLIALLEEARYRSFRQPLVSLTDPGRPTIGHEYLLRGFSPEGDMLSPAVLFDAAKDPRVLFNLDRAARISAVETAARYPDDLTVFVNFMPGSVYDPNVCLRTTVAAAENAGIPPERIVFEIVESERVSDLEHLRDIVNFYRGAGFRIALDDYGSGFNNLDTLLTLRPDFLKLDKSLVEQITVGQSQRDMVGMFATQCRNNGITTVGEGVEDEATARTLHELGVDVAQGYYFGRPVDPGTAPAAAASA